jgi:uncharacterized protein
MSQDTHALAARFFAAIEASDVDAVRDIYHPDCVIWHNYDPLEERNTGQSVTENLKVLVSLPKRILGARYDVVQREATETGFVQQHVLRGTMLNGEPFILPACLICVVEEGRITRLDEYFDPAISARLYEVTAEYNARA